MRTNLHRAIPERMVVLSILPPPVPGAPLAPFGFGALAVDAGFRGEPTFALSWRGYAAGVDPNAMRADLRWMYHPDAATLLCCISAPIGHPGQQGEGLAERRQLDWIPRTGLREISVMASTHSALEDAASLARVTIPAPNSTPLARLHRIDAEVQAAWIFWCWKHCAPPMRGRLLTSLLAWQGLERARA